MTTIVEAAAQIASRKVTSEKLTEQSRQQ